VRDEPALDLVRRFAAWAAARGGRGLFNVQLLRRGGELVLSDVNPRLGTSAVHWRGSGFNPALALCAEAGLLPPASREAREPGLTRSVRRLDERIEPLRLEREAPLRGLVLDLDDTLVPTKQWLRDRLFAALASVVAPGDRARAESLAARVIEEGPRDRLIDAAAAALGLDEAGRVLLLESYTSTWPASCACYPDVRPALDALRRRGLKLGLLTDNPPETQRRKLAASGLSACFDAAVFARETGAEKPDARAFAAVAAALGLPPASLGMAGDNPYRDLVGASEAGFARLFWVRRDGAASSFDPALAGALPGAARFEPVCDLREILARLGPDPPETP
jgi:FMN phosphatase YigB (HAD superfamily)